MTATIGDSWSEAPETVVSRPRSGGGAMMQGGEARRCAHRGAQWNRQAVELAEPPHWSEEPTVAVAYGVLCGVMAAQGRFSEAWQWLGRAERILQPEAEPSMGMLRNSDVGLIAAVLDLLAQTDKPATPPASEAAKAAGRGRRRGVGRPRQPLTEGETRVLRYLPTHLGAKEIADELNLSANTVKTHVRHLYQKLDAHNRTEAVERARAFGVLASPARSG
jgi:DNA-binding CsgD family transcriptional regulator